MKKSIIALAVAGAFVAPSAMAEVTTYGLVQAELSQSKPQGNGDSALDLVDNSNGRLGVKASEDLGNGWKGLAKLEFKIDTVDNNVDASKCAVTNTVNDPNTTAAGVTVTSSCTASNTVSLGARETMVGLKGGAGQFEAGVLKQAYKYMGGVKYDAFVATTLEARGNGGMLKAIQKQSLIGQGGFHFGAIGYENKFGPVKVRLTYSPQTDNGQMTAGAMYEANGIEGFYAMTSTGKSMGGDDKVTSSKIGGAYKMGMHKIMLQLESGKYETTGSSSTEKVNYLAYHGKFGKTMFIFQYGTDKPEDDTKKLTYLALGARFSFSKQTYLYGGYKQTKAEDANEANGNSVIAVGLTKKF